MLVGGIMTVKIRFSRRSRGIAIIEPKDAPESEIDMLDRFYESYGLRDVAWIREVDERDRYVIVLPPTYYLPVDFPERGEVAVPEWL
jgi:hypothetical protein